MGVSSHVAKAMQSYMSLTESYIHEVWFDLIVSIPGLILCLIESADMQLIWLEFRLPDTAILSA